MSDRKRQPVKIKQMFYKIFVLTLLVSIAIRAVGIIRLTQTRSEISEQYEESSIKYNAVNDLEDDLIKAMFRARGYYAFQDQSELDSLYLDLASLSDSIIRFQSLPLSDEEQELINRLSNFYENYTNDILPLAISYVDDDDYSSLRTLSSGGVNDDINEFIEYTQSFNDDSQVERDRSYSETMGLLSQFMLGFILLGLYSAGLLVFMVNRLLKGIIRPLGELTAATVTLQDGQKLEMKSDYRLEELSVLASSINEMARKVQDKEEELLYQNEELVSQQETLESNQKKLQEYLMEIETINKALNQSALLCITDDKGIIIQVNEMFYRISKYNNTELIGNTTRILKSGHQKPEFYSRMWATMLKGKIWTGKLKNEAKDGSHYWIDATIVPFLNEKGKAYRYILIGIDITDNVHNEQVLEQLLSETQKAKEKTENYSNLNKELTATVNRDEFLNRVFNYFKQAFEFDKGILVSVNQKQFASKGLTKTDAQQFLTDEYSEEIIERLKTESYFIVQRESTKAETGIAGGKVTSYDFYTSVTNNMNEVELVFAITRIGSPISQEVVSEIVILMDQLSIALSRIDIYEDVLRERSLNESIVQNVTEGLQLVSLEGELLQANDKLVKLVNFDSYKPHKSVARDIWISDFTAKCQETNQVKDFFEKAINPTFSGLSSVRFQLREDDSKYIQIYSSPVFISGMKTGTIFMYRDITREYEVDAMKSELVSTVSHELRTPLSSVLGFTELLLIKELKPEKQKQYLETIFKEAKRLTNLINDFLDVQKMESGTNEYDMKQINLNTIVREVIDTFKHVNNHHIYLEESVRMTTVLGDEDRLIQLLTNLISNAVKFSPAGGNVAVKITNSNDRTIVSLQDSGIGIAEKELADIFTKFKRIDNEASKNIGGTGLGLAISKAIVEAHHGDIWIDSEENRGTTVSFSLPLHKADVKENHSDDSEGLTISYKGDVLLVEDDYSFKTMLSESLQLKGFNVIHFSSSEGVVETAKKHKLVAVVVDLVLEDGRTGWDLVKTLQADDELKTIPVIISSAIDKTNNKLESYAVYRYLVKPYSPEILSDIILELVEN